MILQIENYSSDKVEGFFLHLFDFESACFTRFFYFCENQFLKNAFK